MSDIKYTVKKNRISMSLIKGFKTSDGVTLSLEENEKGMAYFLPFDSGEDDSLWGRMKFDLECDSTRVLRVYYFATNFKDVTYEGELVDLQTFFLDPEVDDLKKRELCMAMGGKEVSFTNDLLLYELEGRYLYVTIRGSGYGNMKIGNISIDREGDMIMKVMPEVYRERNGFLHRYLSVFSSMYNDFGEQIDNLPKLLDVDTCPKELLGVYAGWMGLDVGDDIIEEDKLRLLVKELYSLNRIKGTKKAVERIAEIMVGGKVSVLEQNLMKEHVEENEMTSFTALFGHSPYDVTILVSADVSDSLRSQIMYIVEQFKPIRTNIRLKSLDESGILDGYSYLDMNAKLMEPKGGSLDKTTLGQVIILE